MLAQLTGRHLSWLRQKFGYAPLLFNQAGLGREEPVRDLVEAIPDFKQQEEHAQQSVPETIDPFCAVTPKLAANPPRLLELE